MDEGRSPLRKLSHAVKNERECCANRSLMPFNKNSSAITAPLRCPLC